MQAGERKKGIYGKPPRQNWEEETGTPPSAKDKKTKEQIVSTLIGKFLYPISDKKLKRDFSSRR